MLPMMGAMAHYAPNRLIAQTMAALPEPDQTVALSGQRSDSGICKRFERRNVKGRVGRSVLLL